MTDKVVNFNIVDTEVNPSAVLMWKKIKIDGKYNASTNTFNVLGIHDNNTEETIKENYPTWKQDYLDNYEDPMILRMKLRDSAKAKLMAGEPLTEDEANTIVL
jgi:hypothetical protein